MTAHPYREDREPCVECARREAEGPHVPWYQIVARELVRPFTWHLFLVVFAGLCLLSVVKHAVWMAQHAPPPGAIGAACKLDGTCQGTAVCVRENPNFYSTNFICVPPMDSRTKQ